MGRPAVTLPIQLLAVLAGLLVSAQAHITAAAGGCHVNIPVLGVVALAVVLVLAAGVLYLARILVRDGLRLRPAVVTV